MRVKGIDVGRQRALAPEVVVAILEARQDVCARDLQTSGEHRQECGPNLGCECRLWLERVCQQARILPDGHPVASPGQRQRPARQLFTRVPLALTVMNQSGGRELIAHAPQQGLAQRALFRAESRGIPFVGVGAVARDERGLSAHGQAHIVALETRVSGCSKLIDRLP